MQIKLHHSHRLLQQRRLSAALLRVRALRPLQHTKRRSSLRQPHMRMQRMLRLSHAQKHKALQHMRKWRRPALLTHSPRSHKGTMRQSSSSMLRACLQLHQRSLLLLPLIQLQQHTR